MGRIGNLLSTWHREVAVGDFTSGVFARAVALGELSVEELQAGDSKQIESAIDENEHFDYYRRRWNYHRQCLKARAGDIHSAAMEPLIEGHDRFFAMHMGSTGLI
jgi:hypothetical protein